MEKIDLGETRLEDIDPYGSPDSDRPSLRVTETVVSVLRSRREDLALAPALKTQMSDMRARLHRLEHRAESKRRFVTSAMQGAQLKKVVDAEFTVSLRPVPPALIVTNENDVPDEYWIAQPPKLDRAGALAVISVRTT